MNSRGSTLIEVLVAMLVLTSGVLAMAQLFLIAAATNATARHTTIVATLAAQKLEQILSTDVVERPETVDYVDGSGRVVASQDEPPSGAVYTRRWTIETLAENTLVIRVRVGRSDRAGTTLRMSDETQLSAIRTRRQP
jgi:Tfp pilus assembly protein PilV